MNFLDFAAICCVLLIVACMVVFGVVLWFVGMAAAEGTRE